METVKKIDTADDAIQFLKQLERLDREEAGKRITIIFDSEAAGLANFDLELVKFLIHVLISFYPNFVNKILVFEMPWILNTAWKIIKSLLPPPAVARIKFVSKANIKSLISESNLPLAWGGEDDWEYDWRSFLGDTSSAPLDSPGGYKLSPVSVLKFVPSSSSSVLESCLTLTNTTVRSGHVLLQLIRVHFLSTHVAGTLANLIIVI